MEMKRQQGRKEEENSRKEAEIENRRDQVAGEIISSVNIIG